MKIRLHCGHGGLRGGRAFSLLEMIGVVVVLAVLAAIVFPSVIRYLDRVAAEREMAALRALEDAFRKAIVRQGMIPAQANWVSFIAAQAGMSSNAVSVNPRHQRRVLVADPGGWLGANLPYANAPNGAPTYPTSARAMFVSSLGTGLPANLESAMNAGEFQKLWDIADGSIPDSSSAIWNGWPGDRGDVKVQRIQLGTLFHRLLLSTYTAATNGQFSINGTAWQASPVGAGYSAWFLQGTPVDLLTGWPDNQTNHALLLTEDISFVYEHGVWRNSLLGSETYGLGDISGIVAAFLAATPNSNAELTNGNAQQVAIVDSFVKYMSNYSSWAEMGFPGAMRTPFMEGLHETMMSNVAGIFDVHDHYPTNAGACVIP